MLNVRELSVSYGSLRAVRDLSFQVDSGQVVALLGANGAGKTSVIGALSGAVAGVSGDLEYRGLDLRRVPARRRVGYGIATVPEGRRLFPSLSVAENLKIGAFHRSDRKGIRRDLEWVYTLFPPLAEKQRQSAAALSGGQGQMLAIGRALMADPRLLLLDEPSNGLAPNLVNEIFSLVPVLQRDRQLAILLVEQNANQALRVASYGYVLEAGALALEGTTRELAKDSRVRRLYLGG